MTIEDRAPAWLRALHEGVDPGDIPAAARHNLAGMLDGWRQWPVAMDFLDPASANHRWKGLMTRLYRSRFDPFLPPTARILDLACGSGRLLAPLETEGHTVTGVDAVRPSLEAAARHAPAARLIWGDLADLAELVDGPFDAALALELLCYLDDPRGVLRQLHRLLPTGAPLIASVEAWPGAVLADPGDLEAPALQETLASRTLIEPGVRHVRCYGKDELATLLRETGFEPAVIEGTHYVLDGPLGSLVDPDRLDGAAYDQRVLDLEAALRESDLPPRAWLAIARVA